MENLIIATDFSESSDIAIKSAHAIAKHLNEKITLLHIDELTAQLLYLEYNFAASIPQDMQLDEIWNKKYEVNILNKISTQLERLNIPKKDVNLDVMVGLPPEALQEYLEDKPNSHLVAGIKPHGDLFRFFHGSFVEKALFNTKADCLLFKKEMKEAPKNLAVAIDINENFRPVFDKAKHYAKLFNASLSIAYVLPINFIEAYRESPNYEPPEDVYIADYFKTVKEDARAKVQELMEELIKDGIENTANIQMGLNNPVTKTLEDIFEKNHPDLIFIEPNHKFLHGFSLGSVSYDLIKHLDTNFYVNAPIIKD